jgi:hypothetical protein
VTVSAFAALHRAAIFIIMNAPRSNIETVARDICAQQLGRTRILPDELRSAVDPG